MKENQNKASQILEENEVTYQKIWDKLVPKTEPQSGLDFGEEEEDEEDDGIRRHNPEAGRANYTPDPQQTTRTKQQKPDNDTPVLDSFGTDMTQVAAEGKLDPVVGREKEIERLAQILSRRKKNNPILIGEPGVGKSAIVEGLALRIVGSIGYDFYRGGHEIPRPVRRAHPCHSERIEKESECDSLHR